MIQRTGIIASIVFLLAITSINAQQARQRMPGSSPQPKEPTTNEAPPPAAPGPAPRVEISIDDARPLAAAASQLQYKFGVPISYEDTQWVHSSDLTSVVQPQMPVSALPSLRLWFDVDSTNSKPLSSLEGVLQEALDQHVQRRNPGEFRLVKLEEDGGFSIVPSRAINLQGTMAAAQSPFDVRISLPEKERSGDETLEAILSAITAASGAKFSVFSSVPMERVRLGANDEVARDVLNRMLRESYDWKAYWHLYYGPSEGYWGVNLQAVYVETGILTSEGKPEIRPVRWPGRPYVRSSQK